MRILLTGATGVIGRRLLPLLIGAGHSVTAVARRPQSHAELARAGAVPIEVDLFAADAVRKAVAGHDAVINLATHLPAGWRIFLPGAWAENDRIRRLASANLVDAAIATGAARFIQESFAPVYPDRGGEWIDERTPIAPVGYNRSVVAPIPGAADSYFSSVSHDDAAAAVVAALDAAPGIYNVVDDEPLRRREFFGSLAGVLGVPPPRLPPPWLKYLFGSLGEMLARSLRISNRKLRDQAGWVPKYPSMREGWPTVVAASG